MCKVENDTCTLQRETSAGQDFNAGFEIGKILPAEKDKLFKVLNRVEFDLYDIESSSEC